MSALDVQPLMFTLGRSAFAFLFPTNPVLAISGRARKDAPSTIYDGGMKMRRYMAAGCLLAALAGSAGAELVTEQIRYSDGHTSMQGYLAWDDASDEERPGILVVHEWWGHNDYARRRAEQLAGMGYIALAVDMYGEGKVADHPDDAGKFATTVFSNLDEGTARFKAAMKALNDHPVSADGDLAAIGYCFGGGIVLHMARFGVDVKGVASFHGSLKTERPAKPGAVKARILVCNGADDALVPTQDVADFNAEMHAAGVGYTFVNYPGAQHSFTNPGATDVGKRFQMPLAYNEAADRASWTQLTAFLDELF
jgi:dienelactone hydrolase